jgi:hypothetical protein
MLPQQTLRGVDRRNKAMHTSDLFGGRKGMEKGKINKRKGGKETDFMFLLFYIFYIYLFIFSSPFAALDSFLFIFILVQPVAVCDGLSIHSSLSICGHFLFSHFTFLLFSWYPGGPLRIPFPWVTHLQ